LGGHQSAKGYAENCDKYNRAVEVGWTMLRYTPEQIKAKPVQIVEQILATIARLERERSRKAA
jgi:very-short-patch-repair endonuclease